MKVSKIFRIISLLVCCSAYLLGCSNETLQNEEDIRVALTEQEILEQFKKSGYKEIGTRNYSYHVSDDISIVINWEQSLIDYYEKDEVYSYDILHQSVEHKGAVCTIKEVVCNEEQQKKANYIVERIEEILNSQDMRLTDFEAVK